MFGGNEYQRFEMVADPELGEMLARVVTDFMDSVREGRPPAPQLGHDTTAGVLAQPHPGVAGRKQVLTDNTTSKFLR